MDAAALEELVTCKNHKECDICIFSNHYKEQCKLLMCTHRSYENNCDICCTRRKIANYCDPHLFKRAHCNPNKTQWEKGLPDIYTKTDDWAPRDVYTGKYIDMQTLKPTTKRIRREKYTTPIYEGPGKDWRREDWTSDQQEALKTVYEYFGKTIGARMPKHIEADTANTTNKPKEENVNNVQKKNKTNSKEETSPTRVIAMEDRESKENKEEKMDEEAEEIIQSILREQEQTADIDTNNSIDRKPLYSRIIRLCLCNDPNCSARSGTRIMMKDVEPEPTVSYINTNTNKKSIQIEFEEQAPMIWQANAAYIQIKAVNVTMQALIDTGSVISIISDNRARQITESPGWKEAGGIWDQSITIKAYGCSNTLLDLAGRLKIPNLQIKNNQPWEVDTAFWVLKDSSEECIISGEWLRRLKSTISLPHKLIYYSNPTQELTAGGDEHIQIAMVSKKEERENKEEDRNTEIGGEVGPIESDSNTMYMIQAIKTKLGGKKAKIAPGKHYAMSLGPQDRFKARPTTFTIQNVPAKTRVYQNMTMLHVLNTTDQELRLNEEATIRQTIPEHARINISEYDKLDQHIHEMSQKPQRLEERGMEAEDETTKLTRRLDKLQAKFDFKEYMDPSQLPIQTEPGDKIILTEYKQLGHMPFNKDTDKLTLLMCYLLMSIGYSLDIGSLDTKQIHTTLQEFQDKGIQKLKTEIDKAYKSQNIFKLYKTFPLEICHKLHMELTTTFDNMQGVMKSALQPSQRKSTKKALLSRLMIKAQALSILMYYAQKLVADMANTYGMHPYFHQKTTIVPKFEEIEPNMDTIPDKTKAKLLSTKKIRANSTRIKNKAEFDQFIRPTAKPYKDREYTFQQYKREAVKAYDDFGKRVQEQTRPPQGEIHKKMNMNQIQSPEEIEKYVQYATSPAAFHYFMKEQLPPSTDDVIPIDTFLDTLTQAKLVIYTCPEEAIRDYIPPQLRPEFDKFYSMLTDPQFIETSRKLRLPDYPQMHVWNTDDEPSPLHNIDTGLVLPEWLAFCATQMLDPKDILFDKRFETELALLAAITFVYGNFVISLHASHIGLFREDVFRAKALLCPHTALQNAKIPKGIGEIDDPDLNDKVDFLIRHGKAVRCHASPFLTSMTSIEKKRKSSKPLEFEQDSPILKHLLSLSQPQQERIAQQSQTTMQARTKLAQIMEHNQQRRGSLQQHQFQQGENHGAENNAPKEMYPVKVQSIRAQRNIPNRHEWTQTMPIIRITERPVGREESRKLTVFEPPIHHEDQEYILETLDKLTQRKQKKPIKKVRWGSTMTVEYMEMSDQENKLSKEPTLRSQYYLTPEDYQTHEVLTKNQRVAPESKHMIKPELREKRRELKQKNYRIKYAFPEIPISIPKNNNYDPQITRNHGMLTNAHAFHKLIEDTATQAYEARIGEDHPRYAEIERITVNMVSNRTRKNLLKTRVLLNMTKTSKKLNKVLKTAVNKIGKYNEEVRRQADYTSQRNIEQPWQKCQKALSLTVGTAMIHTTEEADKLAMMATSLNNFIRARKHQQPLKMKAKKIDMARDLIQGIWPERQEEWETISVKEAVEHFGSWNHLFTTTQQFYNYPIVILNGSVIKKESRTFFDIKSMSIYGQESFEEAKDLFGCLAVSMDSKEIFAARTKSPKFLKFCLQEDLQEEREPGTDIIRVSINRILQLQRKHQQQISEKESKRYEKVEYQHVRQSVYWKRDPLRTIVNTKYNNSLSMETNTVFQSQNEVKQNLANSSYFSSFDISQFYDQIGCCPVSSLLNTVLYKGQELAMTVASMGSRNSCLWATAVVLSVLHHHTDRLLMQPNYLPNPIEENELQMIPQKRQMDAEESYSMVAPTDMPACDMLLQVIQREEKQERRVSQKQIFNFTDEQRRRLREGNQHQIMTQTTLIDDFCIATAKLPNAKSEEDQMKQQINAHLLAYKQLMMSLMECSKQPQGSGKPLQPAKIKLDKTHLMKKSVKFLNFIYIDGLQIIDLEAYKGATNLDKLPMTGEAMSSRISFVTYFISYVENLRFLCKDLEELSTKYPNNKQIPWEKHPDLKEKYEKLVLTVRALSGIQVLPNDLNKVNFLVTSSDACNKTMAYNVGINLKPDDEEDKSQNTKLRLMENYSCNLEDNLLNLPIATKECMSAVNTLTRKEPLLKLLGSNIPKYHVIDNSVLFGLMEQLLNAKQLTNHYMAHPQFKEYVLRLHQLCTIYNVNVLLVPSKQCLADVCTRTETEPKVAKKTACKKITGKPECELCPGCEITCINSTAHKECKFNIRNASQLSEKGPQLLRYEKKEENTVNTEGSTVKYRTLHTHFDPTEYKVLPLEKLVEDIHNLDQTKYCSIDQNLNASERDANEREINKIMGDNASAKEEIEQIDKIIQNSLEVKTIQTDRQQSQEEIKGGQKIRVMPQRMYQINIYSKRKWQPTKRDRNTIVVIFTNNRKSLRNSRSLYASELVGTHTEKLERRENGVTYTENTEGTSYLILCTSTGHLKGSSQGMTEDKFIPYLRTVMREACNKSQSDSSTQLVFDGNSIQKFYNISVDTIMTAIILVTRGMRDRFRNIGLITRIRKQDKTPTTKSLSMTLPIYTNGKRKGILSVKINNQGRGPTLRHQLHEYIWRSRYPSIRIEMTDGSTIPLERDTELIQAKSIQIRERQYVRANNAGINDNNNQSHPDTNTELDNKFTTGEEHSSEPILDAMLAKRKLTIAQANDPYLTELRQQLIEAEKQNRILHSQEQGVQLMLYDEVIYGKSTNNHNKSAWKPVIPEGMLITEIMQAHENLRCASIHKTIQQVEKIFFHKTNVTSHYSLTEMAKKLLPCPRCVVRRPTHKSGNKLYMQTKNIAMSLAGLPCATWAHDIVYLTASNNPLLTHKYLSVIVCYGCSYVHLKIIDKIDGSNIATHLLEATQVSGQIPHILITDSATTELRGLVAKCIKTLSIIQLKTNQQIQENARRNQFKSREHRIEEREETDDQQTIDPNKDPEDFKSVLLEDLTEEQKELILQDFVDSAPPLYAPILSHNPVPYIDKHAYKETSLGKLDNICGEIGVFLRKFITTQPEQIRDETMEYLVQAFAYYHNYLYEDNQIKMPPAKMHLGILRFHNNQTMMTRIGDFQQEDIPRPIGKLQDLLTIAHNMKTAQENRVEHEREQERNHLQAHKRINQKDISIQYPVLSIVMLQNEYVTFTKTSQFPSLHGPHLILAHAPNRRNMYMMNLLEGVILKRSYRVIEKLMPSQEIFSTPNIMDWFHQHPLQLVSRFTNREDKQPELSNDQYTRVLENISKVYQLLKPVLPTVAETQKTIDVGAREFQRMEETNQDHEIDVQQYDPATTRKTVQYRTEEAEEEIVDIARARRKPTKATKKREETSEEADDKDDKRGEEDEDNEEVDRNRHHHQHIQQQGIDTVGTHRGVIEDRDQAIQPNRGPNRPKRTRVVPAKYR